MIPPLVAAGYRAVAMDFIGFGRSEKFAEPEAYSYQMHVDTLWTFIQQVDLHDITLFGQDWGGLVGLRVGAEHPERFSRLVAANTGLPTGEGRLTEAFLRWQHFSKTSPAFDIGRIIQSGTVTELPEDVVAAYDAPFPDDTYKAGARIWPSLVPTSPDQPGAEENRKVWHVLRRWDKPFLTAFSDSDPVTKGGERIFQTTVPGAKDQPHVTITGAGHFLQEDKGEELAGVIIDFLVRTKVKQP
jgi:haloalkane dehalogenase